MLTVEIHKHFPGIAIDVAFEFDRGILVLFGPSGSGKTSILNCIAGLQQPDSGYISLNGRTFIQSYHPPASGFPLRS